MGAVHRAVFQFKKSACRRNEKMKHDAGFTFWSEFSEKADTTNCFQGHLPDENPVGTYDYGDNYLEVPPFERFF